MFEDRTYENLLKEGLEKVSDNILKSEGSLVYNAVSATAYGLERLYTEAGYMWKQADPEQADYENLKITAAARAVYPSEATKAKYRLVANVTVPTGSRFSLSGYLFSVIEALTDAEFNYVIQCETAGSAANGLLGVVTAVDYVSGLENPRITELLVAGRDEDTREQLLQKYKDSFSESSFGGNVTEYKQHIETFEGVGGCKVYPMWSGTGDTIRCVLIGSDYGRVSDYLVSQIQDAMCPEPDTGYGITPIGHNCTIESVETVTADIQTTVTFRSGYSWSVCREDIENAISNYLLSIRKAWKDGGKDDYCIVYVSRLEAAVLDVDGVIDISGTLINGASSNLTLESDQIPVLGEVTAV